MEKASPSPSIERLSSTDNSPEPKVSYHDVRVVSRSPSLEGRPQSQRQLLSNRPMESPGTTQHSFFSKTVPIRRRASYLRNWWLETFACLTCFVAFVAIVVTLTPYQGKPLSQWPHDISVNSVISIYLVVLKITMGLVLVEGLGE